MKKKGYTFILKISALFIILGLFTGLLGCSSRYAKFFSIKTWTTNSLVDSIKESKDDGAGSKDEATPDKPNESANADSKDDDGQNSGETTIVDEKTDKDPKPSHDNTISSEPSEEDDLQNEEPENNDDREPAVPVAGVIRQSLNHEQKKVAITFDDGPDDLFTPQILDILKQKGVKATFFILGVHAKDHQDVLARISEEGHAIGNHSWSHGNFTELSDTNQAEELQRTDELIKDVTGESSNLFRLPYGAYNNKVLNNVATEGYHNIYWSIDPMDWSGVSPKEILDNIKINLEPGAIILLHSSGSNKTIPNTVKALPDIIEYLEDADYEIVTVPDLLDDQIYR